MKINPMQKGSTREERRGQSENNTPFILISFGHLLCFRLIHPHSFSHSVSHSTQGKRLIKHTLSLSFPPFITSSSAWCSPPSVIPYCLRKGESLSLTLSLHFIRPEDHSFNWTRLHSLISSICCESRRRSRCRFEDERGKGKEWRRGNRQPSLVVHHVWVWTN